MKTVKTIYLIVIISITVFVVGFFGARKIRAFSGLFSDADIVKDSVTVEPFKEVKLVADVANFTIVEGDDVLAVIPATASPDKIQNALAAADNVVMMKVYKNFYDFRR